MKSSRIKSMRGAVLVSALGLSGLALAYLGGGALLATGGGEVTSPATASPGGNGTGGSGLSASRTNLGVSPAQFNLDTQDGAPVSQTLAVTHRYSWGTLRVEADPQVFAAPVVRALGRGRYDVTLTTRSGLAAGDYAGAAVFKICLDATCSRPSSVANAVYRVVASDSWGTPGEWQTFQRDAGHTGFVPVTLQPEKFAPRWEWRRPTTGTLGFINAVVTDAGKVFVSDDEYFGSPSLRALSEADGSLLWERSFPNFPALNPPAVAAGKVYVATTGHQQTFLWAFDAGDGSPVFQSTFAGQWPHVLAPTVHKQQVYTNGGYYGGGVYAFNATDGNASWSRFSGDDDMSTPAVDDDRVYYYGGQGLEVYEAGTGNSVASIADPYSPGQGYSYHAAPMLGSPDHVIAFSGGAFSGRASSSVEQYESRPLVNYSVLDYAARWRTARSYLTQPAVANGVVYAASNNPKSFDAIDEATGQVLWSWVPGAEDTEFHRNVVVTRNLAFVSSNRAVYAIDLATHQPVWSHPVPGMLAISGGGTLYIVEGARQPTGRLVAISLR